MTSVHEALDHRIFHKECVTLAAQGHDVVLIAPAGEGVGSDSVRLATVPRPGGRFERMTRTVRQVYAAALALDMIVGATVPPDAVRIRNLVHIAEQLQSDLRHTFLMFAADFTNSAHQREGLFDDAVQRYKPFQGTSVLEVIRETKRILEIIAILGGRLFVGPQQRVRLVSGEPQQARGKSDEAVLINAHYTKAGRFYVHVKRSICRL